MSYMLYKFRKYLCEWLKFKSAISDNILSVRVKCYWNKFGGFVLHAQL